MSNLRRLKIFTFFRNLNFFYATFFLYYIQLFGLEKALLLESIFLVAILILDLPTGYLSDRFGRLSLLVASSLCNLLAYLIFACSENYNLFVVAQISQALSISLTSGTDVSFFYESLEAENKKGMEQAELGAYQKAAFYAAAFGALASGAIGFFSLRAVYWFSIVSEMIALVSLLKAKPVEVLKTSNSPLAQLREIVEYRKNRRVLWLFMIGISVLVMSYVPYEFHQPYFKEILNLFQLEKYTAIVAGFNTAIAMFLGVVMTDLARGVERKIGPNWVLQISLITQWVLVCVMALFSHPLIWVVLLTRGLPTSFGNVSHQILVAQAIPSTQRATFFSLISTVGRGLFAGLLFAASFYIGDLGQILAIMAVFSLGMVGGSYLCLLVGRGDT